MVNSRSYRLTSKQDFQAIFDQSAKITHRYIKALFVLTTRKYARLGISLAKHAIPRAVDRNRLRRIVRESFRQHKEELSGLDIVILIRSAGAKVDKRQLRIDIDHLWQKITARTESPQ